MAHQYAFQRESEFIFSFDSQGSKGIIRKFVTLEEVPAFGLNIYNVILESEIDGMRMGDQEITNNGDPLKVINTVAAIISFVLQENEDYVIYISGSSSQRSAMYQRRLLRVLEGYRVLGAQDKTGPFEELNEAVTYDAFLVFKEQ